MNKFVAAIVLLGGLFAITAGNANAGASEWFVTEGGKIRLLVSDFRDENGRLRGALDIRLKPGWKTYWRDPGSSGIPPSVDVSANRGLQRVTIGFPPPHRFYDPYGSWAGYKSDTVLALTFEPEGASLDNGLVADVFLGICETICVPVQARLEAPLNAGISDGEVERIVQLAFDALPKNPEAGTKVRIGKLTDDTVLVEAKLDMPGDEVQLFIENQGGWLFGVPELISNKDRTLKFKVPVHSHPKEPGTTPEIHYTLTNGSSAISGKFVTSN